MIDYSTVTMLPLLNLFFIFKILIYSLIILIFIFFSKKIKFLKSMPVFNIFFNLAQFFSLFFILYSYLLLLETIHSYIFNITTDFLFLPYTFNYFFFEKDFFIFCSYFQFDLFSLIILFVAFSVGFLCLVVLTPRVSADNEYLSIIFLVFLLVVFVLCFTTNVFVWLIMYECLLLPSFYVVYTASAARRSVQASLYFIIFTQIGSFIVVCVTLYIVHVSGSVYFFDISKIKFTASERFFLYFFLFIGFGIKIPIWPFHYWLTKTHVEASAGFSMYLSGFLVKIAALGFYKFSLLINGNINTSLFLAICIVGIVDASLKLFSQTDLKKIVAYCTILEMNLIFLGIIWGNTSIMLGSLYFIYTHAFLSSLMFFLVDCLQKRYNTRNVTSLCGVMHTTPNLAIAIFLMIVIFSGIPGTMKFVSEITIFSSLNQFSPFFCFFLILIMNFFSMVGFCKSWFNILFGMSPKFADSNIVDLTIYEILVIFFCIFFLVFGTFFLFLN